MAAQPDAASEQVGAPSGTPPSAGWSAPARSDSAPARSDSAPARSDVEQVRPGLWSIAVAWPESSLRYTLAYLLSCPGGVALVDTGWPTEAGWTALAGGIRQAGHELTDVRHVLVTHAHPDHLGMAGQVRDASGAQVGMHPADAATLRRPGGSAWRPRMAGWLRSRGAPADQATEILDTMAGAVERYALLARPDTKIEHGSRPLGAGTGLRAVWTPGHTPGHLCFYDEERNVLLTGDHVLPRISPHIGFPLGTEGDPLGDYLASLRALARYRPAEVLPAHEYRFADLGGRIDALLRHHQIRLAEIEHVVAADPGLSTWAVAAALTWSRGWEQTRGGARHSAVSETYSHLVYLRLRQRLRGHGDDPDSWWPGPHPPAAG